MQQIEYKYRHTLEQVAETKRVFFATEFALKDKLPAKLLVTSASQAEGKTLFSAALASVAAASGKHRVVALDLNWYHPALHRFFNLDMHYSSSKILDASLNDLVCASGCEALDILTAPADYDNHSRMNAQVLPEICRLIDHAKRNYDLAIIDSASIFPTNRMMMDPVMLSSMVDGVLLVVHTNATPKQTVKKAQKILEASGAKILGVIGNQRRISTNQ